MSHREIKFRAWDGEQMMWLDNPWNNYWYNTEKYDGKAVLENTNIKCNHLFYAGILKVMQFIGLQDRGGVNIYEGDKLSLHDDTLTVVIEFRAGQFVGVCQNTFKSEIQNRNWNQYVVIGNIYEHPNLLSNV